MISEYNLDDRKVNSLNTTNPLSQKICTHEHDLDDIPCQECIIELVESKLDNGVTDYH